jgi:Flp pilus assembly protein TadD
MRQRSGIALATLLVPAIVAPGCSILTARDPVFLSPEEWTRALRDREVEPAGIPNPLETTDEIRAFAREVAGSGSMFDRLSRIQGAMFDRSMFTIDQESPETLTAAEAFERRRGNCVSFTNLFLAMARSLGIQLQAGLVIQRESSEKKDDLVLVYTHMVAVVRFVKGFAIYDFFAASERRGAEIRLLDDMALTGILVSNRGVTALRDHDFPLALARFEAAVRLAPQFTGGWGNLGLARWKMGDAAGALAAYRLALAVDSHQPTVLHNLAAMYQAQGKFESAKAALAAADLKTVSPHSLIVRGDLELSSGDVKEALRNYRAARSLAPKSPDPLVAIAKAESIRGNRDAAREALEKAVRLAPDDDAIRKLLESL